MAKNVAAAAKNVMPIAAAVQRTIRGKSMALSGPFAGVGIGRNSSQVQRFTGGAAAVVTGFMEKESPMADPHYLSALIAKAICDARPGHEVDPEDAKQIAKCIVEALTDAGFQISPVGKE